MEAEIEKRIDLAWRECKTWIVEFDGTPRLALLVDVPPEALITGLQELARGVENLRLTRIPARSPNAPEYFGMDSFSTELAKLLSGETAELSANFVFRSQDFDLDLHAIVHPVKEGKVALELDWWSDQVFSSETDDEAQFYALAEFLIELQRLFQAGELFVSPESGLRDEEQWVEI